MRCKDKNNPSYFGIEKSISRRAYNMPGGHMHNWYELYYLIEGERRYFIDGQIYIIHEGDVILIPKGTLHHTTSISSRQHIRYLVEFGDDFIHTSMHEELEACFKTHHFTLTAEQRKEFEHILQKLEDEQVKEGLLADSLFHAYLTELLVILIRRMHANEQVPEKAQTPAEQLIEAATHYITDNLQNNLTLTHVANKFHLSQSYFSRMFKSYTGFGFKEYLTHLRIKKATQLLLSSSASISEIAELCGFTDSNYFSSVFKKDAGIPPIKYRMLRK